MSFYRLMGFTNDCEQCGGVCHDQYKLCSSCLKGLKPDVEAEKVVAFETRNHIGAFHRITFKHIRQIRESKDRKSDRPDGLMPYDIPWQEQQFDNVPQSHLKYHGDNVRFDS